MTARIICITCNLLDSLGNSCYRKSYMACNGNIPDQNYIVADRLDSDANIIWNTSIALIPELEGII